jgi:hypothetical protein
MAEKCEPASLIGTDPYGHLAFLAETKKPCRKTRLPAWLAVLNELLKEVSRFKPIRFLIG